MSDSYRSHSPKRRVLILFCEEGQGHASTAQTLCAELEEQGAEVLAHDAMHDGLGRLIPFLSRDTYRLQVRWLRWSYGLEYFVFTQLAPTRAIARTGLRFFGSRPLARVLRQARPDVIVSTHPAVTNVLGAMRALDQLSVPVVATVTDFGVHPLWVHPALDMHLVMHERLVPVVEAVAGSGSARVVSPIVAPAFRRPIPAAEARRALGLPPMGRVAVISGGGWGVGELERTTAGALQVDDLQVVTLTGRNEGLRRRLEAHLGKHPRLRILPFTNQMPAVLAAADLLVDATVGVTCLEAMACDCPVVVYGAPPGHSRENALVLSDLGLAAAPASLTELIEVLRSPLPKVAPQLLSANRTIGAAQAILDTSARVGVPRLARDRLRTAMQ